MEIKKECHLVKLVASRWMCHVASSISAGIDRNSECTVAVVGTGLGSRDTEAQHCLVALDSRGTFGWDNLSAVGWGNPLAVVVARWDSRAVSEDTHTAEVGSSSCMDCSPLALAYSSRTMGMALSLRNNS